MGTFRLLLAYVVAASHVGISAGPYHLGEIAVVSFFLMSGYVTTALLDSHYSNLRRVGLFYVDRALRLYPQFLFYSLATIVAVECLGLRHAWLAAPPSLASDLAQLTMAPLNFTERFPDMLLPQGWSLGLEFMFYAVFPFVLLRGLRLPAAYASLLIFACAYCGKLSADWFAYRLLPGVLFVFIVGSWLRRQEPNFGARLIGAIYALAWIALVAALTIWPRRASVSDVLIGFTIGLPIVIALMGGRGGAWDRLAGNLSYGVFLNHNLLAPLIERALPEASHTLVFLVLIPLSAALSFLTFRWIETPAMALRYNLRAETPLARAAPAPDNSRGCEAGLEWAGFSSASMSARRARAPAYSTPQAG